MEVIKLKPLKKKRKIPLLSKILSPLILIIMVAGALILGYIFLMFFLVILGIGLVLFLLFWLFGKRILIRKF